MENGYRVATVEHLWEYAKRPSWYRYTLLDRKECAQKDCKNTVGQPGEDPKTRFPHNDVAWITETVQEEKELGVEHEGEWKYEREGYEVDEKKRLRRLDNHVVVEMVNVKKRVRTTEPNFRPHGMLLCAKCRDVIYCSLECAAVDKERHAQECPPNPPDLLKCVVNDDLEGIKILVWKTGSKELLQFFGGHSLFEWAEEMGTPHILKFFNSMLDGILATAGRLHRFDKSLESAYLPMIENLIKAGCTSIYTDKDVEMIALKKFGDLLTQVTKDKAERDFLRSKRRELQALSLYTKEEFDLVGVEELLWNVGSIQEAILDQDIDQYKRIHEWREDLIDYDRDIAFAEEHKLPFMVEWLHDDLKHGIEVTHYLLSKGLPRSQEWATRRAFAAERAMNSGVQSVDLCHGMTEEERREEELEEFEPTVPRLIDKDSVAAAEEPDDLPELEASN
jgi:hypothetical protein